MRLIVLGIALVACASVPTHPAEVAHDMSVRYDPSITREQLSWVREGLRHWCTATDSEEACWTIGSAAESRRPRWSAARIAADPAPLTVWVAGELDPMFVGMVEARGEVINAITDCRSVVVMFGPQLQDGSDWVRTTIHEFGHVLGLDHQHGESMGPSSRSCVSEDTLQAACERIQCGPKARATCE